MHNEIRRQDRKISLEESIDLLQKGEYGVLSMCSLENEGYGLPLSYVYDDGKIYFHCATEGTKLEYIKNNNKVSFCVVGHTQVLPEKFSTIYHSAIAFGTIAEAKGEEKQKALELLLKKYSPDFMEAGISYIDKLFDKTNVLRLSVEEISGKARKQ